MTMPKKRFSAVIGTNSDGKKWYGTSLTGFIMGGIGALSLDTLALAQYINDPELQQAAASLLYYHYGNNQSGRSLVADVGANCKRDIMSSALGWVPGMGNNPDSINGIPFIPYHRHYHSNEIYTQTQGNFAVANAVLNAPAELTFNFKNADRISMKIFDGKDCVKNFEKLNSSETFELTGAKEYEFVFSNGLKFKRNVLCGEKKSMDIDMDNFVFIGSISGAKNLKADGNAEFELPVYAFGKNAGEVWFAVYSENIAMEKSSVSLKTENNKTSVLKLKGKALKANTPFAIVVRPKTNLKNFRAFSGIVR
jgi:hypothetical protein